jgi:hypothetical protein
MKCQYCWMELETKEQEEAHLFAHKQMRRVNPFGERLQVYVNKHQEMSFVTEDGMVVDRVRIGR